MRVFAKSFLCVGITLFATFVIVSVSLAANRFLPPVITYLLEEESLSHLDRVLKEYSDVNSSHIFIAAHRGGKETDDEDGIPGNSIANIDNAVSKGFDLYESDIEILGDGTLVVFHDPNFDNLTNSNVENDLLSDRTIAYAKELFLTYDNGSVSNEKIPTLHEFLSAGKGKIMFKFDLKQSVDNTEVLKRIFDTVVETQTVEQVLIRGDDDVLKVAKDNGYDTRMIMRRYSSTTVSRIENLVRDYDVRAISIPNNPSNDVINAANLAGLVVEVHEVQGGDDQNANRQADWAAKIAQGVRQFHSFKPAQLKDYLEANQHRAF